MGAWQDFRKFLTQGNIVALAVAFVIGLAFSAVVMGFVTDIINPIIGIPGDTNLSDLHYNVGHSTILYGSWFNTIIAFVLIAAVIFFGLVRPTAKLAERQAKRKAADPPTTRECPFCLSTIPIKATKCMYCTSDVPPVAPAAPGTPPAAT